MMKNKFGVVLVAVIALLGVSACSIFSSVPALPGDVVRGSGGMAEETRSFDDLHGVALATLGDLTVELGDRDELRIEAEKNLLPIFETTVKDGVLHIKTRPGVNIQTTQPVRFTLTLQRLDTVSLSSLGSARLPQVESKAFDLSVSGAGSVEMAGLKAEKSVVNLSSMGSAHVDVTDWTLDVSGAGSMRVDSGEVRRIDVSLSSMGGLNAGGLNMVRGDSAGVSRIDLSGAGSAKLGDLDVSELTLQLSSMGSAQLNSLKADRLNVDLSGAGDVRIDGGSVKKQVVTVSSMGSYHAAKMDSQDAELNLSGAGSAQVAVSDHLTADVSSMGSVEYSGSPQVEQHDSGAGDIHPAR